MRSCFQQNFSGLLWVLSLLPLPLSPSLPLTAGGPVIPHAANGGRKRRGGDVSAVLRRQRKRRRTCTWTISTPTSGTSARSVAHPTPAHPAPLRSPLVSVWVVGSQAGQLGSAGSGWFLGQFIGYSHCRSRIDCVALLLNLGSRAWLLIPRIGWFLGRIQLFAVCCCISLLLLFRFVLLAPTVGGVKTYSFALASSVECWLTFQPLLCKTCFFSPIPWETQVIW
jgi:hypothetical protein